MSSRASRAHQPIRYYTDEESDGSDNAKAQTEGPEASPSSVKPSPAPNKKARTTRRTATDKAPRKTRIKMGGFGSKVADFPIDVLYEILSYVDPMDILSISRVNKGIRSALTSKSSRFVWRNTIENAEMPQCPKDLNEMQYAHFALYPFCDFCGKVGRKRSQFHYLFRSREKVCADCVKSDFHECDLQYRYRVPTFTVMKKLKRGRLSFKCFTSSKAIEAWDNMIYGNGVHDVSARTRIEDEGKELLKLEDSLDAWLMDDDAKEASKKETARQARLEAILAKLRAEGWANEVAILEKNLATMDSLKRIKAVNSIVSLTEQAWEKMKPEVTKFMEEVKKAQEEHDRRMEVQRIAMEKAEEERRQRRLRVEQAQKRVPLFRKAFADYDCARPYNPYSPRAVDLAELPEVQALIFKPLDEDVDEQTFSILLSESFDELASEWRTSVEDKLLGIMKRKIPEATSEDVWSPAAIFSCSLCGKLFPMLSASVHSACEQRGTGTFAYEFPKSPWKGTYLVFDEAKYIRAKAGLSRVQPVPAVVSMDLDLYECIECSGNRQERVLTSWFEVISQPTSCFLTQDHSLRRVSLTAEEQMLKNIQVDLKLATSGTGVICSTCRVLCYFSGSYKSPEFEQHQDQCHGKKLATWTEGVDFHRTPDALPLLTFGKDFVLDASLDTRAVILKFLRSSPKKSALDLRTDEEYARQNHKCLRPGVGPG